MNDRLKHFRKTRIGNLTQTKIAKACGITQVSYSQMERTGRISFIVIEYLMNNYNLNANWLITGEGNMEREGATETAPLYDLLGELQEPYSKTDTNVNYKQKYLNLKKVMTQIHTLSEKSIL